MGSLLTYTHTHTHAHKHRFTLTQKHTHMVDVLEQSINCCSERETNFPLFRACCPSNDPVVENAQHEPHLPYYGEGEREGGGGGEIEKERERERAFIYLDWLVKNLDDCQI